MRRTSYVVGLLLTASLTIAASNAEAQQTVKSASAVANALHINFARNIRDARAIIQDREGTYTREQRDAVADALVAIALEHLRTDDSAKGLQIRIDISETLETAAVGANGRPYPGAAERLLRIALAGGLEAASSLAKLPDRGQKLEHLRRLATAKGDVYAFIAVRGLAEMGPEGLGVLRELWTKNLVVDRLAHCRLRSIAKEQGWPVEDYPQYSTRNSKPVVVLSSGCHSF